MPCVGICLREEVEKPGRNFQESQVLKENKFRSRNRNYNANREGGRLRKPRRVKNSLVISYKEIGGVMQTTSNSQLHICI
jgi:hypothetical protein